MGKIYGTCTHEIKQVWWSIAIIEYDRKMNKGKAVLSVCPKCYHNIYKDKTLIANRCTY